jgi:hypothetical protein
MNLGKVNPCSMPLFFNALQFVLVPMAPWADLPARAYPHEIYTLRLILALMSLAPSLPESCLAGFYTQTLMSRVQLTNDGRGAHKAPNDVRSLVCNRTCPRPHRAVNPHKKTVSGYDRVWGANLINDIRHLRCMTIRSVI